MGGKVNKPRNFGTMSEAAFWGWIRSALRKKSMAWKPISEAKKRVKRAYTGTNKFLKWEYQCAHCNNWFPEKEIHVDHKVDAGSLKSSDDLKNFVERLFCEVDGFQILCKTCHHKKTREVRNSK